MAGFLFENVGQMLVVLDDKVRFCVYCGIHGGAFSIISVCMYYSGYAIIPDNTEIKIVKN